MDDLHAAHFGDLRHAAGKFLENAIFPRAQFRQINLRLAESDAAMRGLARFDKKFRRVQERLGWNATAIEANAAEALIALDEHYFFAVISRIKCSRVTPRASADDNYFRLDGIH
jgi:hypothetical protein